MLYPDSSLIKMGANMVEVGDVVVSLDIFKEKFLCDLKVCQGVCCIEGDAGAPVELEEIAAIEDALPIIWNDLSPEAQEIINKQGVAYIDKEGDLVTSIVNGKDCAFSYHDEKGCCFCAIEKAFQQGKIKFRKPISCFLYPIRVKKRGTFSALNYTRWDICKAAVILGQKENLPVFKFLKEPLIQKFGESWYQELELVARELEKAGYLK